MKLKRILQSQFFKHVLTLATGTALAQAIPILLSPIITRLYSPEDFATFEQYAMLLAILGVLSTFKFELSIVQPKSDQHAKGLLVLVFLISLIVATVLGIFFMVFGQQVAGWLNNPDLAFWLLWLPVGLVLFAWTTALTYWFNRKTKYSAIAQNKVWYTATAESSKLSFGYAGFSHLGLVASNLIGQTVACLVLLVNFFKNFGFKKADLAPREIRKVANVYIDFFRFTTLGSLLGRATAWLHVVFFSYYYGAVAVGVIALSRRVFATPLTIFSQSFSQVFYQRISQTQAPRELKRLYLYYFYRLGGLSTLAVVIVQLLPNNTLAVVFGEEWSRTMLYLKILVIWFASNFVVACLSHMNLVLKKQREMLYMDVAHFVLVFLGLWIGVKTESSDLGTLKLFVFAQLVYYVLVFFSSLYFLNRKINSLNVNPNEKRIESQEDEE